MNEINIGLIKASIDENGEYILDLDDPETLRIAIRLLATGVISQLVVIDDNSPNPNIN